MTSSVTQFLIKCYEPQVVSRDGTEIHIYIWEENKIKQKLQQSRMEKLQLNGRGYAMHVKYLKSSPLFRATEGFCLGPTRWLPTNIKYCWWYFPLWKSEEKPLLATNAYICRSSHINSKPGNVGVTQEHGTSETVGCSPQKPYLVSNYQFDTW